MKKFLVKLFSQSGIAGANADANVETESQVGVFGIIRNGRNAKRNRRVLTEVPSERTPCDRDVNFAVADGLEQVGGGIGFVQVAKDAESDQIVYDAPADK